MKDNVFTWKNKINNILLTDSLVDFRRIRQSVKF